MPNRPSLLGHHPTYPQSNQFFVPGYYENDTGYNGPMHQPEVVQPLQGRRLLVQPSRPAMPRLNLHVPPIMSGPVHLPVSCPKDLSNTDVIRKFIGVGLVVLWGSTSKASLYQFNLFRNFYLHISDFGITLSYYMLFRYSPLPSIKYTPVNYFH